MNDQNDKSDNSSEESKSDDELVPAEEPAEGITFQIPRDAFSSIIAKGLVVTKETSFSGPIPPPDMLERYEKALPGSADRIVAIAENEQKIRDKNDSRSSYNDTFRVFGSIAVSISLVMAACFCVYYGQPWAAVALGASGVIPSVIKAFTKSNAKKRDPD